MLPASQNLWLERRQLAHPCSPANCPGMALPVLVGPNRCELIYNHEKQPLIEVTLRVCFPVVELLKALSQIAPPAGAHATKLHDPPAKSAAFDVQRKSSAGPSPVASSWSSQPSWPVSSAAGWQPKKAVEAQQQLYRLEEQELAMLVYLSTRKEARDCLNQAPISEFTRAGGLQLVWRLLDEAFGESEEEQFERAEKEYNQYRRLPGQPVAAYLGQMKRLKAQYQRVDPETHISDRGWGQRLLNRCSLSRRERLDVFFSAGGTYDPVSIERAIPTVVPTPMKMSGEFR